MIFFIGAPIYSSLPHYYGMNNPEITDVVEGLKPNKEKHEPYIKLQQVKKFLMQ